MTRDEFRAFHSNAPDRWVARRRLVLETRDALDGVIAALLAAGLPVDAIETLRERVQLAYDTWATNPDAIPPDEQRAIVDDLRRARGLTADLERRFAFLANLGAAYRGDETR